MKTKIILGLATIAALALPAMAEEHRDRDGDRRGNYSEGYRYRGYDRDGSYYRSYSNSYYVAPYGYNAHEAHEARERRERYERERAHREHEWREHHDGFYR
jgi:hypothetical protein